MKFDLSPMMLIAFIIGLLLGSLLPSSFVWGAFGLWVLIAGGSYFYGKIKSKNP